MISHLQRKPWKSIITWNKNLASSSTYKAGKSIKDVFIERDYKKYIHKRHALINHMNLILLVPDINISLT